MAADSVHQRSFAKGPNRAFGARSARRLDAPCPLIHSPTETLMPRKRKRAVTPQAAPENATPATREFAQHHDVDVRKARNGGVEGYRVLTRLDGLFAARRIGAAEVKAGETYRNAFEFGELGGRLGGAFEGAPSGDGCGITARLDALKRLSAARAVLGVEQRRAMDGLAEDVSWAELGRRLVRAADDARDLAVAALGGARGSLPLARGGWADAIGAVCERGGGGLAVAAGRAGRL